jgi:hypothetical protein
VFPFTGCPPLGKKKMPILGNSAAIVNSLWVYCRGPDGGEPAAFVSFGIYDASVGLPVTWPLVVQVAGFALPNGAPAAWRSVGCAVPLPAGTYALSVISNSGGLLTGSFYSTVMPDAPSMRPFIVAGTCPNPLGGVSNDPANWCLYAIWSVAGCTPTAACCCQPFC